eukprot:GEMP01025593.1.p1 GENE.GEMP01025593.1~~GEMP01025593.1.p1  ORF type:complete len:256 (+),score=72.76 GEMP01025593.1:271-1038(+)
MLHLVAWLATTGCWAEEKQPSGNTKSDDGGSGFPSFHISLGSSDTPFFANPGRKQVYGFCQASPCKKEGCCCWSTFGAVKHPAYPNPEEATISRVCLNAPVGMVFVKHDGAEAERGEYGQRDICCLVQEVDPEYFSKLPMAEAIGDSISIKPQPPQPPPPVSSVDAAEPGDLEDLDSVEVEKAAEANIKAAGEISNAMDNLVDAAEELRKIKEEKLTEHIVSLHRKQVEKIASGINAFASKQGNLLKRLRKHGFQ